MSDFTSVPTVELLTRAADAAGKVAASSNAAHDLPRWWTMRELEKVTPYEADRRMMLASGPDHWRAVEATFRPALEFHGSQHKGLGAPGCAGSSRISCIWLTSLRPLAEQVLQHLGGTE